MKNKPALSSEIRVQRLNETPGVFQITDPGKSSSYWKDNITKAPWYDPEREMAVTILLDTRHVAMGHALVSIGTLSECIVHPRDVYRPAIALAAYSVIVMHNHPSGDPTPSKLDKSVTRRLVDAGKLLQIPIVDHVIIGKESEDHFSYFSFMGSGIL